MLSCFFALVFLLLGFLLEQETAARWLRGGGRYGE